MTELTLEQELGLIEEAETAAGLLRAGLIALQDIDGANQFYRLPMMLLGQGLERLMKIALALSTLADTGQLPSAAAIKRYGHDLTGLLAACAGVAARPTYGSRIAAAEDAAFLSCDADLHDVVEAIAGFGNEERYAELGWFLGDPRARGQDPMARVHDFEMKILDRHPQWKARLGSIDFNGFYAVLVGELTAIVQRLVRAVSRFLVWGLAGEFGPRTSVPLGSFLILRDSELRMPLVGSRRQMQAP